jgi:hypothetical protein
MATDLYKEAIHVPFMAKSVQPFDPTSLSPSLLSSNEQYFLVLPPS